MKTRLFIVALATTLFAAFTSCSKDDAPVSLPSIPELKGDYQGDVSGVMVLISANGDSVSHPITPQGNETAVVSVNADNTISIKEPTFYSTSPVTNKPEDLYAYAGATVRNITLNQESSSYAFNVDDYSGMNGSFAVTGAIRGKFEGKKLILDYTFLHAGGMVGTVHFEGSRK